MAKKDYANHAEAMTDVIDYIVCFYNCDRLHSKLCNRSPNAFDHESAKNNLSSANSNLAAKHESH